MAEAVFRCAFPGQSTTFRQNRQPFSGKLGRLTGTNTAGQNDLLRGRIRRNGTVGTRRTQQKKSREAAAPRIFVRKLLLVLICTPILGPVLGYISFLLIVQSALRTAFGAFNLFSNHAFQFLRGSLHSLQHGNSRNKKTPSHSSTDKSLLTKSKSYHVSAFHTEKHIFHNQCFDWMIWLLPIENFPLMENTTSSSWVNSLLRMLGFERTTLEQTETSAPCFPIVVRESAGT